MRNISGKSCTENQDTFYAQYNFFLIVPFMRHVEKCAVRQATKWQCGACALCAGYLRLETHTQNM